MSAYICFAGFIALAAAFFSAGLRSTGWRMDLKLENERKKPLDEGKKQRPSPSRNWGDGFHALLYSIL